MYKIIVFLICLGSVAGQWGQLYHPQQPQTNTAINNHGGMPWTANTMNNGPAVAAQYSHNSWPVGPQTYVSSATPTSGSYPSSETTNSPYTTTTSEDGSWTTEGEPTDVNNDEEPFVEAEEISKPNDVPGSEMKDALAGNTYEKALVDEINQYRVMHGSAPLRVNADLDKRARLWAQKMASDDRESVDVNSQYGQLTFSGPSEITPNVPIAAARHWYNRIKNYAWDKPSISTKSTQFTQLVWAASQQIGVGIAQSKSGLKSYVAALFSPRGNVKNQVIQNVLPVTGSPEYESYTTNCAVECEPSLVRDQRTHASAVERRGSGAGKRGADSCPKGWHKFKKSCYRYFNNNVKWVEAVNLCDDEHSSLASLESSEEEISVRSMLARDEGTEAWIGLSDRVHPDSKDLIWVDGNPMPYSNWNSYQDDLVDGRKCATLSIATEGWMYKGCRETLGFICKKRLKDIMTYLVALSYPEKLWSDNLRTEISPRYMAMKKHLDQAIMNLYDDDDWFVDMLFEGFSPTPDDKVTAEFKLRFSPDGDAPTDPLEKLRTKLESSGLVNGEKIFLAHVSLQNDDPDSCLSNCINTRSSCSSPDCPVYCCRTFPTRRKSVTPPRVQQQFRTKNIPRLRNNPSFFAKNIQSMAKSNFDNLRWNHHNLMHTSNYNTKQGYGVKNSNYFQDFGKNTGEKMYPSNTLNHFQREASFPQYQQHRIVVQQPVYQELQDEMNKFQNELPVFQRQSPLERLPQFSHNMVYNNQPSTQPKEHFKQQNVPQQWLSLQKQQQHHQQQNQFMQKQQQLRKILIDKQQEKNHKMLIKQQQQQLQQLHKMYIQQEPQNIINYQSQAVLQPQQKQMYSPNFIPNSAYMYQLPQRLYVNRQNLKNKRQRNIHQLKKRKCSGNCPRVCAPSCIPGCCRLRRNI